MLYDALDLAGLSPAARRRAASRLLVTSSLFGVVRPTDRIPAYRLSGDVTLPGLGPVAGGVARRAGAGGDRRARARDCCWTCGRRRTPRSGGRRPTLAPRVATVRVLLEKDGRRSVVSHFNKATKGRVTRDLLESGEHPRTPGALAALLGELGWDVELGPSGRAGTRLDVVVEVGLG